MGHYVFVVYILAHAPRRSVVSGPPNDVGHYVFDVYILAHKRRVDQNSSARSITQAPPHASLGCRSCCARALLRAPPHTPRARAARSRRRARRRRARRRACRSEPPPPRAAGRALGNELVQDDCAAQKALATYGAAGSRVEDGRQLARIWRAPRPRRRDRVGLLIQVGRAHGLHGRIPSHAERTSRDHPALHQTDGPRHADVRPRGLYGRHGCAARRCQPRQRYPPLHRNRGSGGVLVWRGVGAGRAGGRACTAGGGVAPRACSHAERAELAPSGGGRGERQWPA